jgi:hypothetical protein
VPGGERRKVNEAQIDRLFELVGVRAGQHHPRDVRLEHRDLGGRMIVDGGISEGLDESVVSLRLHATSLGARAGSQVENSIPEATGFFRTPRRAVQADSNMGTVHKVTLP